MSLAYPLVATGDSGRRMNTYNSRVYLRALREISDHRVLQPRTTASARRACPRRIGTGVGGMGVSRQWLGYIAVEKPLPGEIGQST